MYSAPRGVLLAFIVITSAFYVTDANVGSGHPKPGSSTGGKNATADGAKATGGVKAAVGAKESGTGSVIDSKRIFITFTPDGGLGNQLEYLTGAMNLSRAYNFTLVPPEIPDRLRCYSTSSYKRFWNMDKLRQGVGGLAMRMPASCDGQINIMFRHKPTPAVAGKNLSPLRYCDRENATYIALHEKPFRHAHFVSTWDPKDPTYIPSTEELGPEILRRASWLASRSKDKKRPFCIWLDNLKGYSPKTNNDEEVDHKFLDTSIRLEATTRKYPTKNMLVFHARVHEVLCDGRKSGRGTPLAKKFSKTHVCLRNVPGPGDYKYVPVAQFARTLRKTMNETGSTSIYMTNAPYLDPDLRKNLNKELKSLGARMEEPIDLTPGDRWSLDTNFAEREIAIKARAFIGEMKSTWTYSVCRKRLSQGKEPIRWTKGLETCSDNGAGCKTLSHVSGDCDIGSHVIYKNKTPLPKLLLRLDVREGGGVANDIGPKRLTRKPKDRSGIIL